MMARLLLALLIALMPGVALMPGMALAAAPPDYSNWAVVIVAGDDHAHDGGYSAVFDNARKQLARAFAQIGFSPANMIQFSVDPDGATRKTSIHGFADGLWDLSERAPGGCLIYFTSHGTPGGIVVDQSILPPEQMAAIVGNACGAKPSVIVMSACFSGQFVPALAGKNRVVITAARPDRTSFGCGSMDRFTYFDDCFLEALPMADSFARLGHLAQDCVAVRERQTGASPPSEPQVSVGPGGAALTFHKS
jgi:hypothetical protein